MRDQLLEVVFSDRPGLAFRLAECAATHSDLSLDALDDSLTLEDVKNYFLWDHEFLNSFWHQMRLTIHDPPIDPPLASPPAQFYALDAEPSPEQEWAWRLPEPVRWAPEHRGREVRFFTYSEFFKESILVHQDIYPSDSAVANRDEQVVCTGPKVVVM